MHGLRESKKAQESGDAGPVAYLYTVAKAFNHGKQSKTKESELPVSDVSGFDAAQKLIVENPGISGPTLLNLLKSKGFELAAPKGEPKAEDAPKEADSAGANVQATRAGAKALERGATIGIKTRFREKDTNILGPSKFEVILIQEGMGNLKDAFYYSRECLEKSVAIFEGKKIYADHPSAIDEQVRPERSVKEIIGHFEKIRLTEGPEGQAQLRADCILLPDSSFEWARALFRHSIDYAKQYPDKDFVGLSINASGDAEEVALEDLRKTIDVPKYAEPKLDKAANEGITNVRLVKSITEATSVDLVTEAGAGGRIVTILEGERNGKKTRS